MVDPSFRRADFIGLTGSVEDRLRIIDDYMKRFPSHRPTSIGNYYSGPHNNREIAKAGFAEFVDAA